MAKNNSLSTYLSYFLCIITYFVATFMNIISIDEYLKSTAITFTEYDDIALFKIYGYMAATVSLAIVVQFFSYKKIILCSLFIYCLSIFNIIFVDLSHKSSLLYFFMNAAGSLAAFILILGYLLNNQRINCNSSLAICSLSITVAYIAVKTFNYLAANYIVSFSAIELLVANIIPFSICLTIIFRSAVFSHNLNTEEYKLFPVIRHMEIEMLIGFSIFYVIMVIINGYEVYALTDSLPELTVSTTKYIILISVFFSALFTPFMQQINKHKVNIASIILLMFLFVSLPYWGKYFWLATICWVILGILIYTLFICSILIFTKKFEGVNLFSALSLYALSCSFGYYCGFVTIENAEDTLGENGFLISISFVLLGLLIYYLYLFKKHRFYR